MSSRTNLVLWLVVSLILLLCLDLLARQFEWSLTGSLWEVVRELS
jgi:hypothetical protein